MSYFPELETHSATDLMAQFGSDERIFTDANADEKELWLMEAAVKIAREAGPRGLDFLLQQVPAADEARLRGILLALSMADSNWLASNRETVKEVLLRFTHDPRAMVVADAIDSLSRLGFGEAEDHIYPLLSHPSPHVGGSVLRFLSRHNPNRAKPLLIESLRSPEFLIRENAVDELDDLGCVEALPQLRLLLDDPHPDVRQAAATAVKNLEVYRR